MSKRKGNPVHGWLILDKEVGITSTQAVGKARKLFNAKKAGHAGTLDPLATGILPIAFGEATKTVPFMMDAKKSYRFTVKWGAETKTDDLEGDIINESDIRPTEADIKEHLSSFIGNIMQTPPKFSAIKIDGERAYKLARKGEDVELSAREVTIDDLRIISHERNQTTFEADCGKGTYIRSIARDLGQKLGCFGHIIQLRRVKVGIFNESLAISFHKILDKINQLGHSASQCDKDIALNEVLKPIELALDDIPAINIDSNQALRLKNGQSIIVYGQNSQIQNGLIYAKSGNVLVAIGDFKKGEFKPTRVFNLPVKLGDR